MVWIVEVGYKKHVTDPVGFMTKKDIEELGIKGVEDVRAISTYTITGKTTEEDIKKISEELLSDNQIQEYGYRGVGIKKPLEHDHTKGWVVEVGFKPGVMDAVGLSAASAIEILGIDGVKEVKTGNKFMIIGDISEKEVGKICQRLLVNNMIQFYRYQKIGES
jgi:phosphoribosylformylglycinamidine (FGAM) synthase PurS component